ncbi:hypothetical protein [Pedobacter sandarakinus]|uniref:hypothetical protein n=1 Tax=Pedobacter sandarakinus TaxID=353156 RepID=UPI002247D0D7|nr:hypothetical protein [Pedobacter sandarakinus]MCX2574894.1 hypothetical protein [Pedobacter sandarakinus]
MDSANHSKIIPEQFDGGKLDVVEKRVCDTLAAAEMVFTQAADRLLNVNRWGDLANISSFQLLNTKGVRVERRAEVGDFIRIDIPGPGTAAGMGYDWVRIEAINADDTQLERFVSMTVRPSKHPIEGNDEIAHFLTEKATSTFIVRIKDNTVFAEEHARNEQPNTNQGNLLDKGRNLIVGFASKLGLSYPQWQRLVKAFLED